MKKKILLLIPYYSNRSAMGLFKIIKDDNHLDIFTLNTKMKLDEPLYFDLGSKNLIVDKEETIQERLLDVIDYEGINQVIPTKDPLVRLCSYLRKSQDDIFFVPSFDIVKKFQDKSETYAFFLESEVTPPVYFEANPENTDGIASLLRDKGGAFLKPKTGSSGQNARRLSSIDEVYWNDDYIVCESLLMPETNQTFVIRDGILYGGITYRSVREGFSPTSDVIHTEALDEGKKAMRLLMATHEYEEIKGVYNLDFMLRTDGKAVLNEINPGRFPAGIYPLHNEMKELVKIIL
jgi:hypothetical protein